MNSNKKKSKPEEIKGFRKKQACSILNLKFDSLNDLIRKNVLKLCESNRLYLTEESVLLCKKDLEERRAIPKPVWIYRN